MVDTYFLSSLFIFLVPCIIAGFILVAIVILLLIIYHLPLREKWRKKIGENKNIRDTMIKNEANNLKEVKEEMIYDHKDSQSQRKTTYRIYWWTNSLWLKFRPDLKFPSFDTCEFTNCNVTYDIKMAEQSDAVIFDGRRVNKDVGFKRPLGQVWIFQAHESPVSFDDGTKFWRTEVHWRSQFNWTMTYDKDNTDIYMPYGEVRKRPKPIVRDFKGIARKKMKDALWVSSHCQTRSRREYYVGYLKKITDLDIDILGDCGKYWHCGKGKYYDETCFKLLTKTYKFYLAFENAYCHQYFTEKFYGNYNNDIILVTLGGSKGEASSLFPEGTFVASDSFPTISALGDYLKTLASDTNAYADMLKRKSEYYSLSIKQVFGRAMCDICKRMNNLEKYQKQIPDIQKWAFNNTPCRTETFKV